MNNLAFDNFLLCRQPILDLQEELVGYALSLQSASDIAPDTHGQDRTAMLVCAAYAEFGLRNALGENRAFIPADLAFVHDDAIEALPPESVTLELVFDDIPDKATLERCRVLRERRYALALGRYTGLDEHSRPLLNLLDVVKIDTAGMGRSRLAEVAGSLARLPLKLLAENVDSREKMQYCSKIGFQLFQGDYFAHPELVSGRRLSASQSSLIQLINLASRDTDTARIEEGFKREPALAVNLLRIVNSVGFGLSRRVTSLRNAITLLGRRQLQRWLQLLLMTPSGKSPDPKRAPLLQVAALRGRMMEILAGRIQPREPGLTDQAFITGIMSMMPAALGMPMEEIFEQIALETEVMQALAKHEGVLGKTLALIECFDDEDSAGCSALLNYFSCPGLDRKALNICLAESLRWINAGQDAA